jgi:hypothetical protein
VPVSTFFDDPTESTDGKETIQQQLQDPDVMELVRTFATISDKVTRRNVLSIVKAAASLQAVAAAMRSLPEGTDKATLIS